MTFFKKSLVLLTVLCLQLMVMGKAHAADKTIGIIVFDGVLTSDITAPIEVFGAATEASWFSNYNVITINVSDKPHIKTHEGLTMLVDKRLSDLPKVDVLLVPSAYDMSPLLSNQQLIRYVQQTAKTAQWMASNCSGAHVLAEAGLLNGKRATTWAGGEAELKKNYPNVDVQFDTNFVMDGNVLTSNGGLVSYEAALALLSNLASPSKANEIREALQMPRLQRTR